MSETNTTSIAIACQGGGSHTAFTAGVLQGLVQNCPDEYEVTALSGTSGGAICAALAWDGLRQNDPDGAVERLTDFWEDIAAYTPWDVLTNDFTLWSGRLFGEFGAFGISPYKQPFAEQVERQFRQTIDRHIQFDRNTPSAPPHLFVGAVNVESGSFEVFADGEEGTAALMASAAIPTLFRAVEIEGAGHWDGLFSQNPPIRHFTTEVSPAEKPDEIWIIRINPLARGETPESLSDIADRRNELAGNLSLEQEKHMIESINEFISQGIITDDRYKEIELREVALDMDLDVHSKLDRSPEFLNQLMDRGRDKAPLLWRDDSTSCRRE